MKRLTPLLLVTVLLPQVAFASWWNPLSWSHKQIPPVTTISAQFTQFYTYYTVSNAQVRECESTDCRVLRTLLEGTEIEFKVESGYSDINKMPEWVGYAFIEDGLEKSGYVNKYLLTKGYVALKLQKSEANAASITPRIEGYWTPALAPQPNLSNDDYYTNVNGNTVHSPAYSDSVPAGASARCRDGTYSFSQNRRGTCSRHGGVAEWL